MVIKRRYKLYKRFDVDIWGIYTIMPVLKKFNPMVKFFQERFAEKLGLNRRTFFVYRIDYQRPRKFVKKMSKYFLSLKLIRLYYLTIKYHQFKKMREKVKYTEGSTVSNFLMLIEGRIISVLVRFQFVPHIFASKMLLKNRKVLLNNRIIVYPNTPVNLFDIVHLHVNSISFIKKILQGRLARREVLFNIPRYMLVSFKLFCGFMYKKPKSIDLGFHTKLIDLQRGSDFF